jgi:hypothetical protein
MRRIAAEAIRRLRFHRGIPFALLAITLVVPPIALSEDRLGPEPAIPPPGKGAYEDILRDAGAEDAGRAPSDGELERSASEYADSSDSDALAVARESFPDLVSEPLWPPDVELADGERIAEYLGPFTARIEHPGAGPATILESAVPLRAPEGGTQRPVDGDLERQGDPLRGGERAGRGGGPR